MQHRTRWIALLSAIPLAVMVAATAYGYSGQVEGSVSVATHGSVSCTAPFTVTARIVDATGAPLVGKSVAWSFVNPPSKSDRVNKTRSVTNAQGEATATVTLGHVGGVRRIRATADGVSASAVLSPACGGGLPRTSTLATATNPASVGTDGIGIGAASLIALGFVIAAGLTARRSPLFRR